MRGAVGVRKDSGLGLGSTLLPEYHPAAGARGERDGNGNSNPNLDRGSCSRSATHPDCNCGKDVSSACKAAAVRNDLRWDDGGESAGDGGGSRGATTSEGIAGEKLFFSTPEIMKVPKEEGTTIESEDAGVQESTLAKLKRRIRLKLLAEEARNSPVLLPTKAEVQEYNVGVGRQETRAEDGPSSSSVRSENQNPCQLHHQQQQQQISQQASAPSLQGKHGLRERVENGKTIVDLSSDDEADVSNPSRIQPQNNNHIQRTAQAPGGAVAAPIRPKEEEVYDSVLEKVLGPLLAKVAAAAVEQSTRPPQKKKRNSGGRRRSKPVSKKSQVGEPRLSASDLLDFYRNSVSAAAHRKRARAPSNSMMDNTPTKRGRPGKGSNTTTGTGKSESRPARGKGGSRSSKTAAVQNPYEEARENNILRNKFFLQELNFDTALETRKSKQTPQPKSKVTAALALALPPPVLDNFCSDRDEDVDVKPNIDIYAEHRVESQRSQVTSASALSGSSSAFQRLDKTPISTDDDLYDPEDELEANDEEDELEDNSSKSSEPRSMRMQGRLKPLKMQKEKDSRRRPKKASATAPNQELIRVLAEVLTSKTLGSLPPNLLQRLENTTSNGGEGEQTGTSQRRRSAASKKKPAQARQKLKRKAESKPQQQGSGSQTTSRSERTAKKQSKDTWLAAIPFETPKTEYELQRDESIQSRKEEFDKLLVVPDLRDKLNSEQAPRQVRPYHKRWTNEPNPEFNRQTRLRDRLSAKNEIVLAVKQEIVAVEDVHTVDVRPNPFADSTIAKFSNWAALQKHRDAAATTGATSREWDLNEPSMSTGSERIMSFETPREGRDQLVDPILTRICTMDVGVIRGQNSGLLAAGGPQGRIAVFALRGSEAWSSCGKTKLGRFSDDEAEVPSKAPLLAWSVDSSWITQVVFLPSQFKEKEMLLLSSSNDGRVVLWDVNQVRIQKGTRELSQEGMPRVVCQTTTLHSGSIFGMHEMDGRMATASEDGVGISVIRETMIFMERCIAGHHSDVIRHIRFRDKNVLADCGADMVIGILDVRCPEPCTLKLTTAHKTAMSTVEWSPGSESVLLSASLDPQIYLHDIRNPRKSLFWHTLEGHAHPRRLKCFSVYRPTFIDGGHGVATPGEGTHQLSLYAVDTGSAIGKVDLGFDTTILHWSGFVPSAAGGLWAGGSNGITHCRPIWRPPSITNGNTPFHELQPCLEYNIDGGAGDTANPDCKEFII